MTLQFSWVRSPRSVDLDAAKSAFRHPLPLGSRFAAIAWKQCRESGPIVLAGVVGVLGIVAAFVAITPSENAPPVMEAAIQVFARIWKVLGFIIAMVVGIGVHLADGQTRLKAFWRSRPINPDAWFWTKYLSGLAIILASLHLPAFAIIWFVGSPRHWDPDWSTILLTHIGVYAAAVAMTCLVQRAVYAAILSIGMLYLGVLLTMVAVVAMRLPAWLARPAGNWADLWEMSSNHFAAGMFTSFVISTLVAWMAVRNDWGWKA